MVHRRGAREGEEGRVVSWQQFVRVTNLQQVKVRGKRAVVGSCCHYKYDMHYGQSQAQKCRRPDQVREGIKERESERGSERERESWPHAATLICAFPSWVRKTKRRRCCRCLLPASKFARLENFVLTFCWLTVSTALPSAPLYPLWPLLSAEINCIRKVAPRRTCAMAAWQRATRCAKLALI